ncbi:hypothetical protein DRJ17_02850 [Candidatus Woesearchaeota archaeon]|nr:MAG: hypothetical protein DRJ17_02850 [Candidatus Woesearchaeota archaeon]
MNFYNTIAPSYDELYEQEQKKKLEIVKAYLNVKETDVLLDVGCGTGISSDFNCRVYGVDPSEGLIKLARMKYAGDDTKTFLCAYAEDLPFPDKMFDKIISLTAAQNFKDVTKAIAELKRVAKDKAKIAISLLKKIEPRKIEHLEHALISRFNRFKKQEEEKDFIYLI